MKFLVGKTSNGTAVFAVEGEKAINLTVLNAAVGDDLMGFIEAPALIESLNGQMVDARPHCQSQSPERLFALA